MMIGLLLLPLSLSLSIRPPNQDLGQFSPLASKEFSFTITAGSEMIEYGVEGSLSDYAKDLNVQEKSPGVYIITGKINLPEKFEPGIHESLIWAMNPLPPKKYGQQGSVSARSRVVGRLRLFNPFPDKYLKVHQFTPDLFVAKQGNMFVKLTVKNYGEKTINNVGGIVKIGDSIGEVPLTTYANLNTGQSIQLFAEWSETEDVPLGYHPIQAFVNYDGLIAESNILNFNYGDKIVKVIDITPKEIESGIINAVTIDVKNVWNENIPYFASLSVIDYDKSVITESKSASTNAGPYNPSSVELFIDAKDLPIGNYKSIVTTESNGKPDEKTFDIKVIPKKEGSLAGEAIKTDTESNFNPTIIIIIIVLIIIIIGVVYWLKNKKGSDGEDF